MNSSNCTIYCTA